LLAPNGGEVLVVGSTFTIQWQVVVPHNTLNWNLEYSISGPSGPWLPIAIDLPVGMTSYQWTVPNAPSTEVRVRVTLPFSLSAYGLTGCTQHVSIDLTDVAIAVSNAVTATVGY
jgi:hypothetical protein